MIIRKLEMEKSYNPAYKFAARVYISLDGGKSWHGTADIKLCNTDEEAESFFEEYKKIHNVA